jgi:2-amino-4-hydroxy-6-hydroxymethyldihydropteridine diphosphokinase
VSHRYIVSFGSNLEPEKHRLLAQQALGARFGHVVESAFAWTEALGASTQSRYLNGAFLFHAEQGPDPVRKELRRIEDSLGRVRGVDKFAPRNIDLDLIAIDGEILHPDYHNRDFVRNGARELAPDLP